MSTRGTPEAGRQRWWRGEKGGNKFLLRFIVHKTLSWCAGRSECSLGLGEGPEQLLHGARLRLLQAMWPLSSGTFLINPLSSNSCNSAPFIRVFFSPPFKALFDLVRARNRQVSPDIFSEYKLPCDFSE